MGRERTDSNLFEKNRKALAERMGERDLALLFSADRRESDRRFLYPYRQEANFFYLTGIEEPGCRLALFPGNPAGSTSEFLFVPEPDPARETWEGRMLTPEQAREISGIEKVVYAKEFESYLLERWIGYAGRILVCHRDSPDYYGLISGEGFIDDLVRRYPGLKLERLNPLMAELRMVKSPEEIELIEKAIGITGEGFRRVFRAAEPGAWEYQLEAELARTFIENLGTIDCRPIVATGANATTLHYSSNDSRLEDGDLVLVDTVTGYANYHSDITRCFPANGSFTDSQRELYEGLLEIQERFILEVRPGVRLAELTKRAREEIAGLLKSSGVLKKGKDVGDYFMHNLGHHLGLGVHDVSVADRELEPGNVITIEPGIYVREESTGIRIEDDILVTEDGRECLSRDIPKDVDTIESLVG